MANISILLILYFNSSRLVFRLVSSISTFGTLHMTSFITFLCWKMGRTINNDLKMSKQIVYNYPLLVKWGNYNLLLEGTCTDKYNKWITSSFLNWGPFAAKTKWALEQILLFPVGWQNSFGLVITGQTMDPTFNKNQPEFRVLIL